jgi:hypothetical protein
MPRLLTLTFAVALMAPAIAIAAAPPAIVSSVEANLSEAANEGWTAEEAADPANVPPRMRKAPAAMFSKVDINGDAYPDWKVSYEKAPNAASFCGTGGCNIEIWAGRPDGGFDKVMDTLVREFALKGPKAARYIDVDFHGSVCGSYGATACPRRYGWDQASFSLQPRVNGNGESILVGGPAALVEPDIASLPPGVLREIERREAVCKSAGAAFAVDSASVLRIPDVNGDRVADWVVGNYGRCDYGDNDPPETQPDLPFTVLVSTPEGLVAAYEGLDVFWQIDIAKTPALLSVIQQVDDCTLEDGNCPVQPLTFAAGAVSNAPTAPAH